MSAADSTEPRRSPGEQHSICFICGEHVPPDQRVVLNGATVGADCFPQALKRLAFSVEDLRVQLDAAMKPDTAFRLGKSTVATIVASRRRAKKRK